jgi:phospholipid transport system transporter-binding protein
VSKVRTSNARLESLGDGRFRVAGILDSDTVTELLEQSVRVFASAPSVVVDLSLVTGSDSAGMALLIEWIRMTRAAGRKIHFDNVPQQIMALARISEVDDLLLENGAISNAVADDVPAVANA